MHAPAVDDGGPLRFVWTNRRLLGFGLLLTLFSSFGQTFFIALSGEGLRAELELSHGAFGTVYSLATLTSAALLLWLGRLLDEVDLRAYVVAVGVAQVVACLLLSRADVVPVLFLAILGLRLSGQGLMSHVAITSMARFFDARRGTAISVAALGHPLGEAVLPLLAVTAIATWGWRGTWLGIAAVSALGLVPTCLWTLRGREDLCRPTVEQGGGGEEAEEGSAPPTGSGAGVSWTRRQVLADPCFRWVLPALVTSPCVNTAIFFHQAPLVEAKGWTAAWLAGSFSVFAGGVLVASTVSGPLVDRYGAVRILPGYLLPLALGCGLLSGVRHPGAAPAFMLLAGLSMGFGVQVTGALMAEVYGVLHLGAIRAMLSALMVFSTSLGPAGSGWLLDAGIGVEAQLGAAAVAVLVATCGAVVAARGYRARLAK